MVHALPEACSFLMSPALEMMRPLAFLTSRGLLGETRTHLEAPPKLPGQKASLHVGHLERQSRRLVWPDLPQLTGSPCPYSCRRRGRRQAVGSSDMPKCAVQTL